ncbi:MAG: hypothetical protein JNK05_06550 [Myxococcales bacterium]|nr:hypothetical protein [Myxococcales bacterium]
MRTFSASVCVLLAEFALSAASLCACRSQRPSPSTHAAALGARRAALGIDAATAAGAANSPALDPLSDARSTRARLAVDPFRGRTQLPTAEEIAGENPADRALVPSGAERYSERWEPSARGVTRCRVLAGATLSTSAALAAARASGFVRAASSSDLYTRGPDSIRSYASEWTMCRELATNARADPRSAVLQSITRLDDVSELLPRFGAPGSIYARIDATVCEVRIDWSASPRQWSSIQQALDDEGFSTPDIIEDQPLPETIAYSKSGSDVTVTVSRSDGVLSIELSAR